ncbi:hypothetical protein JL722_11545 [Aureococcus anophagefferens]|nr:hypothetical protein JL722_11545 [Aureococcus anophagefferens]
MGHTASVPQSLPKEVSKAEARQLTGGYWNDKWDEAFSSSGVVSQRTALALWTMDAQRARLQQAAAAAPTAASVAPAATEAPAAPAATEAPAAPAAAEAPAVRAAARWRRAGPRGAARGVRARAGDVRGGRRTPRAALAARRLAGDETLELQRRRGRDAAAAEELRRVEDEYEPLVAALRATLDAAREECRTLAKRNRRLARAPARDGDAVSASATGAEDVARNRRLDEARGDAARRHDESRGAAAELERRLAARRRGRATRARAAATRCARTSPRRAPPATARPRPSRAVGATSTRSAVGPLRSRATSPRAAPRRGERRQRRRGDRRPLGAPAPRPDVRVPLPEPVRRRGARAVRASVRGALHIDASRARRAPDAPRRAAAAHLLPPERGAAARRRARCRARRRRRPCSRRRPAPTAPRSYDRASDGRLDDAHADAVFVVRAPTATRACAAPGGAPTHPLGGRTFKLLNVYDAGAGPENAFVGRAADGGRLRAAYHEGDAMPLTLLPVEGRPHEYVLRGGAPAAYVSFADDGGWLHARYERRRDAMSVRLHLRTSNNAGTCRGDQFLLSNEFKPSKYAGKWISFSSNGNWLRCTYDRESDAMSVMLFPA